MSDDFKPLLAKLADGAVLGEADARAFFDACLRGEPTPAQIAAAVTALRMRGETVGEIAAGARAMRDAALTLEHPYDVVDTCGTDCDDIALVPCLATFTPPPAATRAAAVEMLRVCRPSPPVPQVSTVS